jgi:peptidoglycan L-alanyl-D-glutamate endopeptidase CwlK
MPEFSKLSIKRLGTCHPDLQRLFKEVVKDIDCAVICGHRGEKEQNEAYARGHSKLKFPKSRHNTSPSEAVDVVPYPLDWKDIEAFKRLMRTVKLKAKLLNISITCGGDWLSFKDYPHYELKTKG